MRLEVQIILFLHAALLHLYKGCNNTDCDVCIYITNYLEHDELPDEDDIEYIKSLIPPTE